MPDLVPLFAINAIHLDQMPIFDYDKLLWVERQLHSVANMTRQNARDFIALAHDMNMRLRIVTFSLEDAKIGHPAPSNATPQTAANGTREPLSWTIQLAFDATNL